MKKITSLLLATIMMVTSLVGFSSTAYAAGVPDYAQKINFGTYYSESADYSDPEISYYGCTYQYDAFKFTTPASGKVTLRIESQNELYPIYSHCLIYSSSNMDDYLWFDIENDSTSEGYSANGYYYSTWNISLSKGTYYLVFSYCQGISSYNGDFYDIKLSYTPKFSNTSLKKVTAKDNAFKATWKQCSNVTGYQIQYSRNKNMSNSKKVKITKKSTTTKTIKKLKNKKKYYVRIRTYKTVKVNGKSKTYYGKWSSKKAVTTK